MQRKSVIVLSMYFVIVYVNIRRYYLAMVIGVCFVRYCDDVSVDIRPVSGTAGRGRRQLIRAHSEVDDRYIVLFVEVQHLSCVTHLIYLACYSTLCFLFTHFNKTLNVSLPTALETRDLNEWYFQVLRIECKSFIYNIISQNHW